MKQILLTQGLVALVDDEDYERVNAFKWHAVVAESGVVHAARKISNKRVYMHTFLIGAEQTDHADTNGLNNQRYNLRPANRSQNQANRGKNRSHRHGIAHSSKWKGVSWNKRKRKWVAYIGKDGRKLHLGNFKDEADAATAYNFSAYEHFGEFARMNTPLVESAQKYNTPKEKALRNLSDHIVEGDSVNHQLMVSVMDEPGAGGACHKYFISIPSKVDGLPEAGTHIDFQNGPIKEVGVNGLTHESLLAILIDRMRSFQAGPYSSRANAIALTHMEEALMWLQQRTRERIKRGVEGTHSK